MEQQEPSIHDGVSPMKLKKTHNLTSFGITLSRPMGVPQLRRGSLSVSPAGYGMNSWTMAG